MLLSAFLFVVIIIIAIVYFLNTPKAPNGSAVGVTNSSDPNNSDPNNSDPNNSFQQGSQDNVQQASQQQASQQYASQQQASQQQASQQYASQQQASQQYASQQYASQQQASQQQASQQYALQQQASQQQASKQYASQQYASQQAATLLKQQQDAAAAVVAAQQAAALLKQQQDAAAAAAVAAQQAAAAAAAAQQAAAAAAAQQAAAAAAAQQQLINNPVIYFATAPSTDSQKFSLGSNGFTLLYWIKFLSYSPTVNNYIIGFNALSSRDGTLTSQVLIAYNGGYIIREGNGYGWDGNNILVGNLNTWYHVAIVGDNSVGTVTYYINGKVVHRSNGNSNVNNINNYPNNVSSCNLTFGNPQNTIAMNDIKVYNNQLKDSDIISIYNTAKHN